MKRATAIGHLVEMAATASDRLSMRDTPIGWPLEITEALDALRPA